MIKSRRKLFENVNLINPQELQSIANDAVSTEVKKHLDSLIEQDSYVFGKFLEMCVSFLEEKGFYGEDVTIMSSKLNETVLIKFQATEDMSEIDLAKIEKELENMADRKYSDIKTRGWANVTEYKLNRCRMSFAPYGSFCQSGKNSYTLSVRVSA